MVLIPTIGFRNLMISCFLTIVAGYFSVAKFLPQAHTLDNCRLYSHIVCVNMIWVQFNIQIRVGVSRQLLSWSIFSLLFSCHFFICFWDGVMVPWGSLISLLMITFLLFMLSMRQGIKVNKAVNIFPLVSSTSYFPTDQTDFLFNLS